MNTIFNEDCRETLKRDINFNYVFAVPPDFDELDMNPKDQTTEYMEFLSSVFEGLIKKCNVITIAITDRKFDAQIIPKHSIIISYFNLSNFRLISHKIWKKTDKVNLYRLTYTHIMTFSDIRPKQNHPYYYETDVYSEPEEKFLGYQYAIPVEIVKRLVENFTKEGDIVYDPFMGSGSTAIACMNLNRNYIGSEIKKEYWRLSQDRILLEKSKLKYLI